MTREDFDHDARCTPYINCRAILCFPEKELGRAVPNRNDPICIIQLAAFVVESSEPKIGEFKLPFSAHENVGGFDIAMENASAM